MYYSLIASEAKRNVKYGEGLKILSPKQMLQRLPITLPQVKAGDTSENLLNKIRKIYREEEITEKLYNNTMNSIKSSSRMITIFIKSENSKTTDPHRLLFNLTDKKILKEKR